MARNARNRYVAFRVRAEGEPSFDDLVQAIRRRDDHAWLIDFDGTFGIVRCDHTARDETVAMLTGIDAVGDRPAEVETLGTSGTLRACRERFVR